LFFSLSLKPKIQSRIFEEMIILDLLMTKFARVIQKAPGSTELGINKKWFERRRTRGGG
jgi:hypothetical protein